LSVQDFTRKKKQDPHTGLLILSPKYLRKGGNLLRGKWGFDLDYFRLKKRCPSDQVARKRIGRLLGSHLLIGGVGG